MFITREFIRQHPDWLFVFGDNLCGIGMGGQALVCRDEPNVIGIPTKKYPDYPSWCFFCDSDFGLFRVVIDYWEKRIFEEVKNYKGIYILPDIGKGLARLPEKSPLCWEYLKHKLDYLSVLSVKEN